jgi:hypothetical protein
MLVSRFETLDRGGHLLGWAFTTAVAALLLAGCGKGDSLGGPGLSACRRDPAVTGCRVTWSGNDSGSSSCNAYVTAYPSASVPWTFWLDGGGGSSSLLSVGIDLSSAPSAAQSFSLAQTVGASILLTRDTSTSWTVNKYRPPGPSNTIGDLLLRADEVVPGSANIHGSLAGSLAPNASAPGPGVTLCATF